jgi:hypothetical protein
MERISTGIPACLAALFAAGAFAGQGGSDAPEGGACAGLAEERAAAGGVCADLDLTPPEGLDAWGRVTLQGEWDVAASLRVGGEALPLCIPACFGDNLPGATYFAFEVQHAQACAGASGPTGAVLRVTATDSEGGLRFAAEEGVLIPCKS